MIEPLGGAVSRAREGETAFAHRRAPFKAKYDPTNFFRMNQNVKPAR